MVHRHRRHRHSATWEPQATAFAREGYRVISFDRRGWGKSLADPATGPQPGSVAGDLDALANHLGLDKFHLVGVAGGGFVSLDYAAWGPPHYADSVTGLTFFAVVPPARHEVMQLVR
jgi:pimeloyl-ACP methyl ester carboxylesterase